LFNITRTGKVNPVFPIFVQYTNIHESQI